MHADLKEEAARKLSANGIAYIIHQMNPQKINVFFGEKECIEVINQFGNLRLKNFTPEQDFMLGVMLGYDRLKQCSRYLQKVRSPLTCPIHKF
jgi:hypothetical protein